MNDHCPDVQLIKLGAMGEYGASNSDIEEGWLDIEHKGCSRKFLYLGQTGFYTKRRKSWMQTCASFMWKLGV